LISLSCESGDSYLPVELTFSGLLFKYPMCFSIVILYNSAFHRISLSQVLNGWNYFQVVAGIIYTYQNSEEDTTVLHSQQGRP
jgi:hypothetical protein